MNKKLPPQEDFYKKMAGQLRSAQVHIKVRPATNEMLYHLGQWAGLTRTQVIEYLIHQAYADAEDGEVLAFEE